MKKINYSGSLMALYAPTNGKTTPPTRKMWSYAALGSVVAAVAAAVLLPASASLLAFWGVYAAGTVISGLIGYSEGKAQEREEIRTGMKKVPEPTIFNSGMAKGYLISEAIGTVAGAVATIVTLPFALTAAPFIGVGVGLLATVGSFIKFTADRKSEMKREYKEAEIQLQQMNERERSSPARSQEQGQGKSNEQSHSKGHDFSHYENHPAHNARPNQWQDSTGRGQGAGQRAPA